MMLSAFKKELQTLTGEEKRKVLLAVSGGVDSMVMASLFIASQSFNIAVAHVNFGLRGNDSETDEVFVQHWAERNSVPFYVQRFDTLSYARTHKCSVEMAAREIRYQWFEQLRLTLKMDWVAVAHNANDHAETIILNLIRGTGLRGLCGIPDKRGAIIRPMLHFGRTQIETYAQQNGIPYREDATNALNDFSRNRIRNRVLPVLTSINPRTVERINASSLHFKEAHYILEEELEKKRASWCRQEDGAFFIELAKIAEDSHPAYWLYELLCPYGFGSGQMKQIIDLIEAQPGRKVLSDTHILYKDRGVLALFRIHEEETLPKVHTTLHKKGSYSLSHSGGIAALDANKIQFPFNLRKWVLGDRFIPLGMHTFKKVSDFLTDLHLPLWEKERQLVLCSGKDIVWVVGKRIDERYKIDKDTENIVEVICK